MLGGRTKDGKWRVGVGGGLQLCEKCTLLFQDKPFFWPSFSAPTPAPSPCSVQLELELKATD